MSKNQIQRSIEKFLMELDVRIRARYPLIAINTFEEDRVRECLKDLMCRDKHKEKPLYFWSRPGGLQKIYEQQKGDICPSPRKGLIRISKLMSLMNGNSFIRI